MPLRLPVRLAAFLLAFVAAGFAAENAPPPRQTFPLAMRDGTQLATDVYLPSETGRFPVVLLRSPYNKTLGAGIGADGTRRGYAIVIQDTRGRFASQGENLPFHADGWGSTPDGWDTIEWIRRQPWCNGRIGTWGGSALGITQLLLAGTGHPHLHAQHITVGEPNLYRGLYPGGVFKKAMVEDWLRISAFATNALAAWTRHPAYDDYWRERDLSTRWRKANAPAVHIGGWFDIFAQGTIDSFLGYQLHGGRHARGHQHLVIGPWTHGVLQDQAGELRFPGAKEPPGKIHDPWRWFDWQLKGQSNALASTPAVTYYVMGDTTDTHAPGNTWRTADAWPPPSQITPFYLHPDRSLSTSPRPAAALVAYEYQPAHPVPTVGGPHLTLPAGPMDQKTVESRPDVVVFSSEPLPDPIEVTGRVRARLFISSDAPDTDFFVRLCDVYPDGRSFNLCEGMLRARFRKSFSRETRLEPGKVYPLDIDLWSTSVVFNRGHRIRVQVTSSSAPGYDPNPNTGDPFRANSQTRVARNTIHLDGRHPSHLLLPVVTSPDTPLTSR